MDLLGPEGRKLVSSPSLRWQEPDTLGGSCDRWSSVASPQSCLHWKHGLLGGVAGGKCSLVISKGWLVLALGFPQFGEGESSASLCSTWFAPGPPLGAMTLSRNPVGRVTLRCWASSFFPPGVTLTWPQDGEPRHQGILGPGTVLPHGEGTYLERSRGSPAMWDTAD